jgi:peptide deformylase
MTRCNACGVGLAAPQVGKAFRLFIIDTTPSEDEDIESAEQNELKGFKRTLYKMLKRKNGALMKVASIPDVREDVYRNE